MAAIARRAIPSLIEKLKVNTLLIDAIYNIEERECYTSVFKERLIVVSVTAHSDIRVKRLAVRPERPLTPAELEERDNYELSTLRLTDVIATAEYKLTNNSSMQAFEGELGKLPFRQWSSKI